jgi:hypothetical protein
LMAPAKTAVLLVSVMTIALAEVAHSRHAPVTVAKLSIFIIIPLLIQLDIWI